MLFGIAEVASAAGPPIELELVTEQGLQITAPQQWLQLLAGIGIEHVQIRGARKGDEPKIMNRGTARAASYQVVGVLTSRDQLRLPGGTFTKADRTRLKDYFAQLGADGADAVAAPRVGFGLTEKELTAVLADLAQPIDFETKGLTPGAFIACDSMAFLEVAQAHDRAGRADSAIAAYRRFVNFRGLRLLTPPRSIDVVTPLIAPAWRRLGELLEAKGDERQAIEAYERFLGFWRDADPDLQPIVRSVRDRVARLRREIG